MDLSAIPLSLVPLTFACAIVRYRLADVEVIVKRGMVWAAALAAVAAMYAVLLRVAGWIFLDGSREHTSVIAMLATLVVVLVARPLQERDPGHVRPGVLSRSLRLSPGTGRLCPRPQRRSRPVPPRRPHRLARDRDTAGGPDGAAAGRGADRRVRGDPVGRHGRRGGPTRAQLGARRAAGGRRVDRPRRPDHHARHGRRRHGALARAGAVLLRPVRVEGPDHRRARARAQGARRAAQLGGSRAARGRRRAGGDRARERPPLSAAPPEGRGTRPAAGVQREHPRVARRRSRGGGRPRPRHAVEPRAGAVARRHARRGGRAGRSPSCSASRSRRR